jgi:uncharacterized membrane protein YhaH (DUF805 family)
MAHQPNTPIAPWYRKLARPVPIGPLRNVLAPMWLLFASIEIGAYRPPKPHWLYIGEWVLLLLWAPLWALMTRGRLIDLRLSPYWVLPLAVVWCVLIFASWWFIFWLVLTSMGLVVLLELPLCLMPSRIRDETDERAQPA